MFFCVLLFMADARPGQADAHDALAVRWVAIGGGFVLDDDSQDELMRMIRMMLEPWSVCPSQTPGQDEWMLMMLEPRA